ESESELESESESVMVSELVLETVSVMVSETVPVMVSELALETVSVMVMVWVQVWALKSSTSGWTLDSVSAKRWELMLLGSMFLQLIHFVSS
ncbi:hypothetical protein G195_009848, partial [Phytophthora kernoviae 00238/432]